ncbi:MAG: dipeptidase, partial [Chloroflexota bacterium]|nr:dipeptidase [Chloroflexota bacterium]
MAATWDGFLAEREEAHLAELREYLRIPSVSTAPEHKADVARAAEWTADRMREAGVPEVAVELTAGHPVVTGEWRSDPNRPTVLVYGHYDVQPAEPLDLWETPPFEPTVRDGRLYARGSSDMKGNLLTAVQGVEAVARAEGAPPVNVRFLFEGEEEIGSPNLEPFIEAARDRLACDAVLCADGGMFGPEQPSLVVSTKGLAGCQIDLRTARGDLHSGMYGGFVPNAVQALGKLLATFHDEQGRVLVEGFHDKVRDLAPEERAEIAAVPFDQAEYREQAGVEAFWGDPDFSPLERAWTRPTLDLNGAWGGYQGDGSKTVTPSQAHAKITCRLVPDQDPDEILDLVECHVQRFCPPGATATVTRLPGSARPWA